MGGACCRTRRLLKARNKSTPFWPTASPLALNLQDSALVFGALIGAVARAPSPRYKDINGDEKAINGDFSKLRHVPTLKPAAAKVLTNTEARTRNVPGTHEVRKTMRHQTHSYRVAYGLACFFTFSPSERDTTLMLRLARARQSDPALANDQSKAFYQRSQPALDVDFIQLSPEALAEVGQDVETQNLN